VLVEANGLVKVVAVLCVTKTCTCSYTRTLRFLIPRSCAYLDSLGKFGIGPKSGFKNKCRVRTSKSGQFATLTENVCEATPY